MTDIDNVERRRSEFVSVLAPRRRRTQRVTLRQRLKTWNNIPDFLRDNEFIRSGYRANWSLKETFLSLFQLHNETLNVWTHLLGFFLFVGLTVYVAMSPPAPLAHPRESLESLWSSVQDKMQLFGDHLGDNVHSLHDSLDLRISLLQDSLQQSLTAVQTHLHDHLEHARESLHVNMKPVSNKLHKSFGALSDALHHFQESLGNVAGSVNTKLSTARVNLKESVSSLQESLHNLQHDLSGNLESTQQRIMNSVAKIQENLSKLQALLRDTGSKETPAQLNTTSANDQCRNTDFAEHAEGMRCVKDRVMRWPVFLYMAGAMFCLLVSSVCHLFACCSQHAYKYMWRFDYTGISVLIVTSFYPAVYYGFLCHPHWMALYLGSTTLLGLGAIVMSLVSYMQKPKFRPFRAAMFSALGLFGVVPWAHQLLINFHEPTIRTAAVYEIIMAAFYLGGAGFFVARVPERFKPGAFDILLHSHQIFHTFVVIAAWIHFQAVMHLMEWREATNGCLLT